MSIIIIIYVCKLDTYLFLFSQTVGPILTRLVLIDILVVFNICILKMAAVLSATVEIKKKNRKKKKIFKKRKSEKPCLIELLYKSCRNVLYVVLKTVCVFVFLFYNGILRILLLFFSYTTHN